MLGSEVMQLRPYQHESVAAVTAGWKDYRSQLLVLPTGSGKTVVFSHIAKQEHEKGARTLILAHREELIDQAIEKLHRSTGLIAQKEKAEWSASLSAPVVVASVQTMSRRLDKWPRDHFGLVVADEAHHAITPSWRSVLDHFSARTLGVTATADRSDKRSLGEFFENVAYETTLFQLVNDGFLSPIAIKSIPLKIDLSEVGTSGGDFDATELSDALDPHLEAVGKAIIEHASFRKVLIFLPLRKTSRAMVEILRGLGLVADHVDGESPDRKEILTRFAGGGVDVLCNAMLLTEGYDDPSVDCVVCLRPTKSRSLYAQIVGRGTRIAPGKEQLLLLDFLWMHEKHQICRPAHLISKSDEEAEQITRKLAERPGWQMEMDLQDAMLECQHDRETALAKKLREQAKRKASFISAEEFSLRHQDLALAEYEPTMKWERKSVSEKQANILRRAKIDPDTVKGNGHAQKLIDVIFREAKVTLASAAQQALMARMGHPSPHTATTDESRRFFAALKHRKAS